MAVKIKAEPSEGGVPPEASSTALAAKQRQRSRRLKLRKKPTTLPTITRPRARKLKRRVSDTRPEIAKAGNMVCVWGGDVKKPVVVQPIWEEAGKAWMSPNEHWLWLRRACSEKGMTHYKEKFQSAVSALRRELQDKMKGNNNIPDPGNCEEKGRAPFSHRSASAQRTT